MNRFAVNILLLLGPMCLSACSVQQDTVPLSYRSPAVQPEMVPGVLVVKPNAPISEQDQRQLSAIRLQDSVLFKTIKQQETKKHNAFEYYQQVHQRLDGLLLSANTESNIHIDSYKSAASRIGNKQEGLHWVITGLRYDYLSSKQVNTLSQTLQNTASVLRRYERVAEQRIDWSKVNVTLTVANHLQSYAQRLPSQLNSLTPIHLRFTDLPFAHTFVLSIESSVFFQKDYAKYLDFQAEVDQEINFLIRQHAGETK